MQNGFICFVLFTVYAVYTEGSKIKRLTAWAFESFTSYVTSGKLTSLSLRFLIWKMEVMTGLSLQECFRDCGRYSVSSTEHSAWHK